jgi:hypothetical protein
MSKKLVLTMLLVSLLAVIFATAAAPAVVKRMTLVETVFLREKGVTFKFQVEGNFRESDLKGYLVVEGKSLKLRCNYNDGAGLLNCTAPGGTAKFAGTSGYITMAGFSFVVYIPARNIPDRE